MGPIFEEAKRRLLDAGGKVTMIASYSVDAMPRFNHGSLAVVYVDGNHSYETAFQDLTGWWGKIRCGGLIGTHDCYIRKDAVQNCGVWDAVWDFAHQIDQKPFLTNCGSAWWIKP